jgi:chitinase
MAGGWDTVAGHQANVYKSTNNPSSTAFSADDAIAYCTAPGRIPPNKMILGMPIYGRSFLNTDGPGKPFSGVGSAQPPGSWEAGAWDYKALPRPGATEHYDSNLIASWSYDPASRMMVTYDTPEAEKRKVDYIKQKRLGGAMWWESSADKKGKDSLIWTVAYNLGGQDYSALEKKDNLLNYPQSKYDNLRKQFPGS